MTAHGQWEPLASAVAAGPSGRMRPHAQDAADVSKIEELLHEKAFQAGRDTVTIAVQRLGFTSRRPARRAGPPTAAGPGSA